MWLDRIPEAQLSVVLAAGGFTKAEAAEIAAARRFRDFGELPRAVSCLVELT